VQERLLRMSELSDSVVAHAEAVLDRLGQADEVRRQLDQLVRAIGEAAQRVTDEVGSDNGEEHPMADQVRPLPPPDQPRPPLRPVQAQPAREHDEEQEEARLVALQMAVAGRSREAVAAHLREAFSIEDPEPILEQIFTGDLPGSAPPS
jgi:hypothetical protein